MNKKIKEIEDMDEQALILSVASWSGYTNLTEHEGPTRYISGKDNDGIWTLVPNFPKDLNAMHKAEDWIPDDLILEWWKNLAIFVLGEKIAMENWTTEGYFVSRGPLLGRATAIQRARAFILTMDH